MGALKTYLLAALLSLPALAHAQAWKCQINGKTVFSDVPCPEAGRPIDTQSGQTRGVTGPRQEMLREQAREQAEARRVAAAPPRVNAPRPSRSCPTALQVRNWETALSAQLRASPDAAAAQEGLKRAKWCAEGKDPAAEAAKDAEAGELAAKIARRAPNPPRVCTPIGGGQVLCP